MPQQTDGVGEIILHLYITWSAVSCFSSMDTPFRIPKKKQPSDSDTAHTLMQSPLSCLQPSTPNVKVVLLSP